MSRRYTAQKIDCNQNQSMDTTLRMGSQLLPKFRRKATMRATSETRMSGLLFEWVPRYSMARLHRERARHTLGGHN